MYFAQNKKQKFVRLECLFNAFNTKMRWMDIVRDDIK